MTSNLAKMTERLSKSWSTKSDTSRCQLLLDKFNSEQPLLTSSHEHWKQQRLKIINEEQTVSHILIKRARNNNYTYREKDKETPLTTYPDKKDTSTFSTSKDETDCCSNSWLSLHQNNFIYYLFNLLYLHVILYSSLDSMMSHAHLFLKMSEISKPKLIWFLPFLSTITTSWHRYQRKIHGIISLRK